MISARPRSWASPRDLRVLLANAPLCVDHEHDHVAALDRPDRLEHAQAFDASLLHASLTANPSRVDQDEPLPVALHQGIDAIDRGPWAVVDQLTVFAAELIHQRRFARIRSADDRHPRNVQLGLGDLHGFWQAIGDRLFQLADAAPVKRRDRQDRAHAELVVRDRVVFPHL